MTFEVEWTSEAWSAIRTVPVFERAAVIRAAAELAERPGVARRPRRWRVRRGPGYRLLYWIGEPADKGRHAALWLLRATVTGPGAPRSPSAVGRAEARELERHRRTLRRIGGGIPHAVVRRHWLAEMERDLGAMARDYRGDAQAARRLLEALLVAEEEGVAGLARIRRDLGARLGRRRR
jgi:hypothetical protein